jgi:hypothetical protein
MGYKANKSTITICACFVVSILLVNIMQSCSDEQKAESQAAERQASTERFMKRQEDLEYSLNKRCRPGSVC